MKGDLRLLVTFVGGKPKVVLYQPVAAGGTPWTARTEAGGETRFDNVAEISNAKVVMQGDKDFTVEMSVPLNLLGVTISPTSRMKMDWGVLISNDGNQVKQRLYWANKAATGTADEAVEARLEPHLWGFISCGDEVKNAGKSIPLNL